MKKKKCTGCGTTHDCKGNKASANEQIKSITQNKTLEYGKKKEPWNKTWIQKETWISQRNRSNLNIEQNCRLCGIKNIGIVEQNMTAEEIKLGRRNKSLTTIKMKIIDQLKQKLI
jgi:hypothetical protein